MSERLAGNDKKVQEDVQISKQQPAEKHARAKKGVAKTQEGPQVAERGVEAQKREAVGGKAQKNAVARDKSAVEGKAPEAKAEAASHEAGVPATEHADAQATNDPLGKDSQAAPSSPDVGQAVPKDIEGAAQAVQQLAASPGKQAADAIEAVSEAIGRSEEDAEITTPSLRATPPKEGNLEGAYTEEAAQEHKEKLIGAPSSTSDAQASRGAGGAGSSGGEVETASPQKQSAGGGGDAGGGGVGVPSIGGAVQIPAPKQVDLGDGAIGAWAAPGMSARIKGFSTLGGGLGIDATKAFDASEAKLPDEGKAEEKDTDTAAMKAKVAESAERVLAAAQGRQSSELMVPEQAAAKMAGSEDVLGEKPPIEADESAIEMAGQMADSEKVAAQADGATAHGDIDRTLEKRGFADVVIEKIEISKPEYNSTGSIEGEDLDLLEGEAAEILDASEFAAQNVDSLKAAEANEKQAYEEHDKSVDDSLEQCDTDVAAAREKAHLDEEAEIEQQGQELNSQLDSEKAGFDSEIEGKAAEAKADTDAARAEIDAEKRLTQSKVDSEYDAAKRDEAAAGKEGENKKKSWWDKVVDAAKQALDWLKSKVKEIFDKARQLINSLVEGFINFVAKISKALAEKLRALFEALKALVSALIEALKAIVHAIIEAVKAAIEAIVQWLKDAIAALIEGLKAVLKAIQAALLAALDALEALAKAIMETGIGQILKKIFEAACTFAGIDPSIFSAAFSALRDIISNPGQFFSTLGRGIVAGFKQFAENIVENLKVMFGNLLSIWLGDTGVKVPDNLFSVPGIIQFCFSILGFDVSKIIKLFSAKDPTIETAAQDAEANAPDAEVGQVGDTVEAAPAVEATEEKDPVLTFLGDLQSKGIEAVISQIIVNFANVKDELFSAVLKEVVQMLIKKGIEKLVLMCNPVGAIAAALKAAYDLYKFISENLSKISGLISAILSIMGAAAQGDEGPVANAVEATLCQAIPLVIDLVARLVGINVGAKLKPIIKKIQDAVEKAVGSFIEALIGKRPKTKAEKKKEDDQRAKDRNSMYADSKLGGFVSATEGMNNFTKDGKKLINGLVFNPTGMTNALQGNKHGNLGVNLNNSKLLKAHEDELKAKRDPEQARLEAWFKSKEGPDGDLPPDMTREEYDKWQLGNGKLDEQRALDQVDGNALLALRAEEQARESEAGLETEAAVGLVPEMHQKDETDKAESIASAIAANAQSAPQAATMQTPQSDQIAVPQATTAHQTAAPGIVLVDGIKLSTNQALDEAEKFLGSGYKDMGNGRFVSADGTRQVRMADEDILGKHAGGPHINLEELHPNPTRPTKVKPINNMHIYLID